MKIKILPLLIWLLLSASVIHAEKPRDNITVDAEGYGISRADALLQAKRQAVETGIGTVLISQTEVKNFELQKDIILTKTIGSVREYHIVKEEKQADKSFYLKIRAVVSVASIQADLAALKILLESMDKPRMMVAVSEEHGNVAESAILDYLTEKDFDLVDPSVVAELMNKEEKLVRQAAEGDPVAAARIGAANGAEYVLVGKVTKDLMKNDILSKSGMSSGQSYISVKVVNCSTARIITSKSANGAAVHVSEEVAKAKATEKASKKLMDRALFEKIVTSFQDMINNGITLDVTVKGVKKFKMQKEVSNFLGALPQMVSVSKRSFGGGQLSLSVLYKGNAYTFGEMVEGKSVDGKKLSVVEISGNRVVIDLE